MAEHIPEEQGKKLVELMEAVPQQNTLLHGDYHTNNIMVQNGEPLLIDMDTLCMGHPVFELGSMFNAFIGYSELDHQVTMNVYVHPKKENVARAGQMMDELLGSYADAS